MQKFIRVNEQIRANEVRVIGPNSEQLGVFMVRRAIELAREHELDLVEIAPTAKPPVCRIIDFTKYKYDQEKKERKIKKNQKITHLKEIRFKPHIEENDYQVKLRQVITFLERKDKVKANMFFKGRESMYRDLGQKVLDRLIKDAAPYGEPEKTPAWDGKAISIVLTPVSSDKLTKTAEAEE